MTSEIGNQDDQDKECCKLMILSDHGYQAQYPISELLTKRNHTKYQDHFLDDLWSLCKESLKYLSILSSILFINKGHGQTEF